MNKYDRILEDAFLDAKKETATRNTDWLDSPWPGFFQQRDAMAQVRTHTLVSFFTLPVSLLARLSVAQLLPAERRHGPG